MERKSSKKRNRQIRKNVKVKKKNNKMTNTKVNYDNEVKKQIRFNDEYIDNVNDIIQGIAKQLDTDTSLTKDVKSSIDKILNTMDTDLKNFINENDKIVERAEEYINDKNQASWDKTSNSIILCTDLDSLRNEYVSMSMLNHQSILDILAQD